MIYKNRTFLVTGGTGSFGQHFVRSILRKDIHKVVVFSRDELKQHEMRQKFDDPRIRFLLGDVRDLPRLDRAFAGVDYVIHAAALKRVDDGAINPEEIIKTNIQGTMNVCDAAIKRDVRKVIFLSSDKACYATNIYGGSKFVAEQHCINANAYSIPTSGTQISCTRYGNVLGSRGSVVHIFRKQAKNLKPITLTDVHMSRYWLTLNYAVDFVLRALQNMKGGEIWIPLLPSMYIEELAEVIIEEQNAEGLAINVVGLRAGGEKINETLLADEELNRTVGGDFSVIINPSFPTWDYNPWIGDKVEAMNSGTNKKWVTKEEMLSLLSSV